MGKDAKRGRPRPPGIFHDRLRVDPLFVPAPDLDEWARSSFIGPSSSHHNSDHDHLEFSSIGWLWTDEPNARHGMAVAAQAELATPPTMGGKWGRARWQQQVIEWFGQVPDFIVTVSVPIADSLGDTRFCALIEHELYHCGQARDEFGAPKFRRDTGKPVFAIRGHDVEEFVGVVRRYGSNAGAGHTKQLVDAAMQTPAVCEAETAALCGTCAK